MAGYGRNDGSLPDNYNEVRTEPYDRDYRSSGGSGLENIKEKIPGTDAYKAAHQQEHQHHHQSGQQAGYGRDIDDGYGAGTGYTANPEVYGSAGTDYTSGGHRKSHVVSDPVYGATDSHKTNVGAKAESALHGAKAKIPGTQEHKATHPETGQRSSEGVYGGAGGGYGRHEAPVHGGQEGYSSYTTVTHGRDDLGPGTGNTERETQYGGGYDNEVTRNTAGERGYSEHQEGGQSKLGQIFEKVKAVIPGTAENKEKKSGEEVGRY